MPHRFCDKASVFDLIDAERPQVTRRFNVS
jgi:hypothetical protein